MKQPETISVPSGAAVGSSALFGGFGVGYTTALGDWILMKIFTTRAAAEEDLPKWGNGIVPNARFDVRDISQDMLIAAVNSGCPHERKCTCGTKLKTDWTMPCPCCGKVWHYTGHLNPPNDKLTHDHRRNDNNAANADRLPPT